MESSIIEAERIKPVGAKLFVRKCQQRDPEYIILPEQAKEQTSFCEILAVGDKCKIFTKNEIGAMVELPEFVDGMHNVMEDSSEYWIVDESVVDPVVYEN